MIFSHTASFISTVAFTSSPTIIMFQEKSYIIRPYVTQTDHQNLKELCEDVWDGTDYLPNIAEFFERDQRCDFVVIQDSISKELVAVGNRRLFDMEGNMVWIEAIRTSKKYQGRGIARMLISEMINRSISEKRNQVMSCTIQSNQAMKKVLATVGMECLHEVHFVDFDILRKIPNWSTNLDTSIDKNRDDTQISNYPQNLVQALGFEHLISSVKAATDTWVTIKNVAELEDVLLQIQKNGGIGQIPGLGKLLWMSDELWESLSLGLVRRLAKPECKDGHEKTFPCLIALVQDPAIQSLKSKYVCSIVAFCNDDFESALHEACNGDMLDANGRNIQAFALTFDGCLQPNRSEKRLSSCLPLSPSPFLIYTKSL